MLNQQRSGNLARLKYLLAVPICGGLLCVSTLAFSKNYGFIDIAPHRINKNNKSPQVAEPMRRLLVTQHGVSVITDKFSHQYPNGSVKYYTAHNLSNKAIEDLKKEGVVVNIISGDEVDTPKRVHFTANNNVINYNYTYTTTKGYNVVEDIHNSNGGGNLSKKVIITDKDGSKHTYYDEKISTDERKMLLDKYGYKFPSGKLLTVKLLPPPLPSAPSAKKLKLAPPPPPVPTQPKVYNRPPSPAPTLLKNFTLVRPGVHKLPPSPPTVAPIKTTKLLPLLPPIPGFFTKSEKAC